MIRKFISCFIVLIIFVTPIRTVYGDYSRTYYPQTYQFYMELGKEAYNNKDYYKAIEYFQLAHLVAPHKEEPLSYINLIMRLLRGETESLNREELISRELRDLEYKSRKIGPPVGQPDIQRDIPSKKAPVSRPSQEKTPSGRKLEQKPSQTIRQPGAVERVPKPSGKEATDSYVRKIPVKSESKTVPDVKKTPARVIKPDRDAIKGASGTPKDAPSPEDVLQASRIVSQPQIPIPQTAPSLVELDEELFANQPITLRIELYSSVVLEGKNIERFLVITPDVINVERMDRDHIKIMALKKASTILLVWDDKGRWTFNVEVILPVQRESIRVKPREIVEYEDPFKLAYSADWSSYYLGQSLQELERKNLYFLQWTGAFGRTPYGYFDTGFTFNKFTESTELIGYTVGLTDGQIGNFKDFDVRGYDTSSYFSSLTLPGNYFRGISFSSPAFNRNLKYTYARGQTRSTFGYLPGGLLEERQSYIEGAKVTLFPEKKTQYSLNFARGFGNGREEFLEDRVFSLETKQHLRKNTDFRGELAYDEDDLAETAGLYWHGKHNNLRLDARDIDRDYTTITNFPSNRGEVGASLNWDWFVNQTYFNSYLDVYRDRFLPNRDNPDAFNFDFNSSLSVPLSLRDTIYSSIYYIETPGELAPRQNLRLNSNYSRRWSIGKARDLTTTLGGSYQRSRFDLSPVSEYDRYSLMAGFNVPLMDNLNYYANYEMSWVEEVLTGDHLRPSVFNTGISYSRQLSDAWSGNLNLYYRDEEKTEGQNSFLAGEDSLNAGAGLTFSPTPDFEFFVDTSVRNVWAESTTATSFNDLDIRTGVRSAWELPLTWNPAGIIKGTVYKDLNSNHRQDDGEKGISNVGINIGRQVIYTDKNGYYTLNVRAKRVQVSVNIDSIPKGYVFSTPSIADVTIEHNNEKTINFGLNTQSGVYGLIYYDKNDNGKPDPDDQFIPNVKIILDGTQTKTSDFEGVYYFQDLSPGRHTLRIVVNSLPIEYIPKIKVTNDVEVVEGTTYIFHIPLTRSK